MYVLHATMPVIGYIDAKQLLHAFSPGCGDILWRKRAIDKLLLQVMPQNYVSGVGDGVSFGANELAFSINRAAPNAPKVYAGK